MLVKADISNYVVTDLDPCEGYQTFIPTPNDDMILRELGVLESM